MDEPLYSFIIGKLLQITRIGVKSGSIIVAYQHHMNIIYSLLGPGPRKPFQKTMQVFMGRQPPNVND